MAKINVLHLRDSSGIYGAERVILTLGKNIDVKEYQFILLCMRRSNGRSEKIINAARKLGITVQAIRVQGRFDILAILKLRKLIKKKRIDIIHSHDFKSDFYSVLSTCFLKTKRVTTAHGSTRDSVLKKFYLYITERYIYRYFNKVIAVSEKVAHQLPQMGNSSSRIEVIQNCIDPSLLKIDSNNNYSEKKDSSKDITVFGVIGRLFPDKGHLQFIKAFSQIQNPDKKIKAIFVGDGPYRKVIEDYITTLGLNNDIILIGFQSDMMSIYNTIDYLVIPSLREGIPYVLLEGMSLKKPILATTVGDIPKIIQDNISGTLVAPGDSEALSKTMEKMITSPAHFKKLAEQAYIDVKAFYSAERMVNQTENMYRNLVRMSKA